MASFVDADNQELLWKMFHRLPNIDRIDYETKANIFKGAIETVYNQLSPNMSFLSKSDLQEVNKQTMTILINNTRARTTPEIPVSPTQVNSFQPQSSSLSNVQMYETAQEKTQRIFEEKQQQYQSMNAKPNLPKPSELFEEKLSDDNDGVITNMDELLAQYERQRQQDVPVIESVVDVSENKYNTIGETSSLKKSPKEDHLSSSNIPFGNSLEELHEKIKQLTSRIEILELSSKEFKETLEKKSQKDSTEEKLSEKDSIEVI